MQNMVELAPKPLTLLELQAKVAYQGRMIDILLNDIASLKVEINRLKPVQKEYGGLDD